MIRHVLAPVTLGAVMYLSWRSPTLLVFNWVRAIGWAPLVAEWRVTVAPLRNAIPDWILFSLPDVLWVYALTAVMALLWTRRVGHPASSRVNDGVPQIKPV